MPSPPEVLNTRCRVGIPEIFFEVKSKHMPQSNGHITISRKIIVDLQAIENGTCPCRNRISAIHGKDLICRISYYIRDQKLLSKSKNESTQSIGDIFRRSVSLANLFCDIAITHDWPCDQLREEGNIQHQVSQVFLTQ